MENDSNKFRDELVKICKTSGYKMCPGCGLTVAGFDKAINYAYSLGVKHARETQLDFHLCVDCGVRVETPLTQCQNCRRQL